VAGATSSCSRRVLTAREVERRRPAPKRRASAPGVHVLVERQREREPAGVATPLTWSIIRGYAPTGSSRRSGPGAVGAETTASSARCGSRLPEPHGVPQRHRADPFLSRAPCCTWARQSARHDAAGRARVAGRARARRRKARAAGFRLVATRARARRAAIEIARLSPGVPPAAAGHGSQARLVDLTTPAGVSQHARYAGSGIGWFARSSTGCAPRAGGALARVTSSSTSAPPVARDLVELPRELHRVSRGDPAAHGK